MTGERRGDEPTEGSQMTIRVPHDVDNESYVRGLRDMAEYIGGITGQSEKTYNQWLEAQSADDGGCPECGEEMIYNPASGERECLNNHE
jgi:hypothetical protein